MMRTIGAISDTQEDESLRADDDGSLARRHRRSESSVGDDIPSRVGFALEPLPHGGPTRPPPRVHSRCPSSSVMLDLAIAGEREMQSYRLPFLAVIALWLLPIQAIGAERPVLGQGNISCSLWLEGRQTDSPSSASRTAWILGFISAFSQYGLQSQGADVSEGKNTDELMGWIDNYCRQHQGDDLHTASEAFIDDFRQRTRR
jgi:hypothetical protein